MHESLDNFLSEKFIQRMDFIENYILKLFFFKLRTFKSYFFLSLD